MVNDNRRLAELADHDAFIRRHNGPGAEDVAAMLAALDMDSLETLVERTVPADIRLNRELELDPPRSEAEALDYLQRLRSEEHTSELQSRGHLVCRLLLEKKNKSQRSLPHAHTHQHWRPHTPA